MYSTFQKGCPAQIKLCASKDESHLVVTSVNSNHNHELNKVQHFVCLLIRSIYMYAHVHVSTNFYFICMQKLELIKTCTKKAAFFKESRLNVHINNYCHVYTGAICSSSSTTSPGRKKYWLMIAERPLQQHLTETGQLVNDSRNWESQYPVYAWIDKLVDYCL